MTTTAPGERLAFDVVFAPAVPHPVAAALPAKERLAAGLQLVQRKRAQDAAAEARFILEFAALCPDTEDPPPDHPAARKSYWRSARELPGVSDSFLDELALVLGVGRKTAGVRAGRAFAWRDACPLTFASLGRGDLDERRAQILADTLAGARPDLARRAEVIVLPEAASLSFSALARRLQEVLLELDPTWADETRKIAQQNSDVFLEPAGHGRAVLGAELDAAEAAEGRDFVNTVAVMRKKDGDPRPIGQIRTEVYSLLLRGAAIGAAGARATLTITAALEALEGGSTQPGDVNGWAVTPAALADLLRRIGALGLRTPDGGELTFGVTDADGTLLATLSPAELERAVRDGEGAGPPPATGAYAPPAKQRRFVKTRDRTCRWPFCGQQVGWADLDHVIPHACGGPTACTNLCCLCRTHHRIKTLYRGWTFRMEPDGTLHVTTPSGITRTTRPWAQRRRPPPEPPPDDPPPF